MPHANFAEGTKVCSRPDCQLANQPQLLTNFGRWKKSADGVRPNCKACEKRNAKPPWRLSPEVQAAKREQAQEKKTAQRTALVIQGMNKVAAQQGTLTEELAAQWVHAAGGIGAMANGFWATMKTASETTKIRGYQATIALMKDASAIQQSKQQDIGTISDELLDQLLRERLIELAEMKGDIIEGEEA
jgi:hypothetical protein